MAYMSRNKATRGNQDLFHCKKKKKQQRKFRCPKSALIILKFEQSGFTIDHNKCVLICLFDFVVLYAMQIRYPPKI